MKYEDLELHLGNGPLARKHVNAIRACAGTYSHCRGYSHRRYLRIPATERALIDDLVRTYGYGKVPMIARIKGYDNRPAWIIVHYVNPRDDESSPTDQFDRLYDIAERQAVRRGIMKAEETGR